MIAKLAYTIKSRAAQFTGQFASVDARPILGTPLFYSQNAKLVSN